MRAAYIDRPSPGAGKACLRRNICLELATHRLTKTRMYAFCGPKSAAGATAGSLGPRKRLCSRGTENVFDARRHGRREETKRRIWTKKYLEALEFDKIRARAADGIVCPEARGMLLGQPAWEKRLTRCVRRWSRQTP